MTRRKQQSQLNNNSTHAQWLRQQKSNEKLLNPKTNSGPSATNAIEANIILPWQRPQESSSDLIPKIQFNSLSGMLFFSTFILTPAMAATFERQRHPNNKGEVVNHNTTAMQYTGPYSELYSDPIFYTGIRASTANDDINKSQITSRVETVTTMLAGRITVSTKVREQLDSEANSVAELRNAILELSKNKELYCKLTSILKGEKFHFEICAHTELEDTKNNEEHSEYDESSNIIKIPPVITRPIEDLLSNSIHRAFLKYQNEKNNRNIVSEKIGGTVYSSFPCDIKEGCRKILTIINDGSIKVKQILNNSYQFSKKERDQYLKAVDGYQPQIENIVVTKEMILPLLQKDDLDEQSREGMSQLLKNKDPDKKFQFERPIFEFTTNKKKRYAYEVVSWEGHYLAKTRIYTKKNDLVGPLLDLEYAWESYQDPTVSDIPQVEAIIHQLFYKYPAIREFIFPGLSAYYENRSDPEYQHCASEAPEISSISLSQ